MLKKGYLDNLTQLKKLCISFPHKNKLTMKFIKITKPITVYPINKQKRLNFSNYR